MKVFPDLLLSFVLFWAGCSKHERAAAPNTNSSASGNPLTAPVDYLGAVAQAKNVSEKTTDTTSVNQAIQLFYAQEDRFPSSLQELVSKHYIAGVPPTPAGSQWAYNPKSGEIRIVKQP